MNIAKVRAVVEAAPALGRGWLVSNGTLSPVGTHCVLGELCHAMGVSDEQLEQMRSTQAAQYIAMHGDYEATVGQLMELLDRNDRAGYYDDTGELLSVKQAVLLYLRALALGAA